ncbi:MAG: DUF4397 domain-containing protein [Bacteroidota bacterium]
MAAPAWAQTARVQIVHNSADPAAAVVDVYVEQISTDDPAVDDLAFRNATPFIDLPAGQELTLTIAPGSSFSAADGIASFPATLVEGETYSIVASGVLDPSQFEANPDGRSTAFTLLVADGAQETSADPSEVQFNVGHGSTDAPTVDVVARGVGTLVDDAAYTDITPYIGVPAAAYTLDVTTEDGETVVATFAADLSFARGQALTILASGFLSPENDQDGSAFGLLLVFPNGGTALLPASAPTATVQIIHNAADPAAAVVDIYIEEFEGDEPVIDDLAFRTSTGFLELPGDVELTITIAPGDSESAADGIASFPTTLAAGGIFSVIANGVLDPSQFEANPNGRDIGFTLFVDDDAQQISADPSQVQFAVVHGSTDAPTVDVIARDVTLLVDGATYSDITPYIGVPPASYILDVAVGGTDTVVASFEADLSAAAGGALTILASGFLSPENDQDGEAFGLLAVFPDGTAALLPAVMATETARAQIIHNAADPAAEVVDIYIEEISTDEPAVEDLVFRTATPFIDLPAEQELTITVAPGNSESAADGIASFPATLTANGTFSIIANGVLDPSQFEANPNGRDIGFTLFIDDDAQEASTNDFEVQFAVVHGSTDAPTVDVVARDVARLVDNATYGDITPYIGVAPDGYFLQVTLGEDNDAVVATFAADLSAAVGGALTVLASGFLSPENDQDGEAFGLLAVFPDGTAALLPPRDGTLNAENTTPLTVAPGGSIAYDYAVTNNVSVDDAGQIWFVAEQGGEVIAEEEVRTGNVPGDATVTASFVQNVPGNVMPGAYTYRLRIGDFPATVLDENVFEVTVRGTAREGTANARAVVEAWEVTDATPWRLVAKDVFAASERADDVPAEDGLSTSSQSALPTETALTGAYPNPFSRAATVAFALPEAVDVRLAVYDVLGREVARLVDGQVEAGRHQATLDGAALANGIYIVRLAAGAVVRTERVTLVR